mgnify:CR=1 FL=1
MALDDQQPSVNLAQQQFMTGVHGMPQASQGSGAEDAPGTLIDTLLRMIGIKTGLNGHSTGGLDAIFNLGGVFSGLSLQGKSIFTQLDKKGGVLSSFASHLGFTFGGNIHQGTDGGVKDAPVDTSGGGGDAQYASLNTIPTAAIHETGIQNIQAEFGDAMPTPRASAVRASRSSSEGEGMGIG